MRNSSDAILTSHAGSLPRPADLIELNRAHLVGDSTDEAAFEARLRDGVADVVRRQREVGIDIPNDGEYGHTMGYKVDYGAWWTYVFARLGGLELAEGMHLRDIRCGTTSNSRRGKIPVSGVVSHATNLVEHPEVVADRIVRYAEAVGRENVIAGTDCGLGGRVHPQIAWAKLESLARGAQLATRRLWR
jgi:methionine synthase II (cobalamin-independent)